MNELDRIWELEQYIGGVWSPGRSPRVIKVVDPADGTLVSQGPVSSDEDVVAAVQEARAAAHGWALTPAAERAACLRAAADAIERAAETLAALVTREMGRPLADARRSVLAGVATLRQYAELGPLHRGRSLAGAVNATDLMVHEPYGVIAVLTPWNDPVAIACGLIGAALVTGNPVVHKPSERTPATGMVLSHLLAEYLPRGVLSVLVGDGPVGARLVAQPVDLVAHVGSTATGRFIAAEAAVTGAKVLLENGGVDPLVVDAGVDPRWAASQAALGAFANAGQLCTSVERIYVVESVADEFIDALADAARALRIGPGMVEGVQMGPLVDVWARKAVHAQVREAMAAGARLVYGGRIPDGPGAYYPPTVLADCTDEMTVVREETFGPVAPVVTVASFEEALKRAAASRYGLAATVLTPSMAHAQRAWRELPVGTVKINAVFGGAPGGAAQPRAASGQGFGYGPELLDEMTRTKVVHLAPPPG